jgi:hypothetical protein
MQASKQHGSPDDGDPRASTKTIEVDDRTLPANWVELDLAQRELARIRKAKR